MILQHLEGWKVDESGNWSRDSIPLGEHPADDLVGFFTGQGFRALGTRQGLDIYSHPDPAHKIRYVVLASVGDQVEVVTAEGLPHLSHALRDLAALEELLAGTLSEAPAS